MVPESGRPKEIWGFLYRSFTKPPYDLPRVLLTVPKKLLEVSALTGELSLNERMCEYLALRFGCAYLEVLTIDDVPVD